MTPTQGPERFISMSVALPLRRAAPATGMQCAQPRGMELVEGRWKAGVVPKRSAGAKDDDAGGQADEAVHQRRSYPHLTQCLHAHQIQKACGPPRPYAAPQTG